MLAVLIGVGRHHGQRLCGRGQHRRPPSPRPVRPPQPGGLPEALSRGPRPGPAEDHVQDGHRGDLAAIAAAASSRRSACRARWWPNISPTCPRASPASAWWASSAGCWSCTARAWREDTAALPIGGFYRYRRGGEAHAWEAGLIHMLQSAVATRGLSDLQEIQRGDGEAPADRHPRPAGLRSGEARRSPSTRSNRSPRSASASTRPACRWARSRPRRMARSTSP